jgi:hypothetical protein
MIPQPPSVPPVFTKPGPVFSALKHPPAFPSKPKSPVGHFKRGDLALEGYIGHLDTLLSAGASDLLGP